MHPSKAKFGKAGCIAQNRLSKAAHNVRRIAKNSNDTYNYSHNEQQPTSPPPSPPPHTTVPAANAPLLGRPASTRGASMRLHGGTQSQTQHSHTLSLVTSFARQSHLCAQVHSQVQVPMQFLEIILRPLLAWGSYAKRQCAIVQRHSTTALRIPLQNHASCMPSCFLQRKVKYVVEAESPRHHI